MNGQSQQLDRRTPPVRSASSTSKQGLTLGPVDSDSEDDDESSSGSSNSSGSDSISSGDSSSGSTSSGSSSSATTSSSGSLSTSTSSSSSTASFDDDGIDEPYDDGAMMGEDSYNSDSHHSEPIKLNPSSPRRSQVWAAEEEGSASPPDPPDDSEKLGHDDGEDDDDGGGDDTVVPGTEALQDEYWDPSSGHQTQSSAQIDDDENDDDASASSFSASNSDNDEGPSGKESSADEGGPIDVADENDGDIKDASQSSSVDSDQGVATMAYETEEGKLVERDENGVAGHDTDEDGDDLPVVMHPWQKQPRDDPSIERAADAADSRDVNSKDAVDAMETGQYRPRQAAPLLDYDDEPPDATYGEDVEEGNLEDFAVADAKDDGIREAPTESFSRDGTEAEELPKDKTKKEKGNRKRTYIVMGVVAVVAVAAIVGGVVGSQKSQTASTGSGPSNPNQPPTKAPSSNVVISNQPLFDMVANASADGGAAILQSGTPQNLAYASLEGAASQYQPSRWLQRYALRTFYYATNGPTDWVNRSGWNETDTDECLWHQAMLNGTAQGSASSVCNQNHVLQALMLVDNNVTGTLPPELSLLTGLTRFYVMRQSDPSYGSLTGGIPSTLAKLTRLEEFGLGSHNFTEPIPVGLFDAWAPAKLVEISESNVPGNFPSISKMTALRNLNFQGNDLRGPFPADELAQLSQLTMFSVDGNQLSGSFPPGSHGMYTSLGKLRGMGVAKNRLVGSIPAQFGNLASLKQRLDLSSNSFVGTLPTELNQLAKLQRLVVSYNQFTGPVPDLSSLSKLKQLSLEGNKFSGTLSNGTCALVVANSATASADCNRNTGAATTSGTFLCPCCTTCCVSTTNGVCQTVRTL